MKRLNDSNCGSYAMKKTRIEPIYSRKNVRDMMKTITYKSHEICPSIKNLILIRPEYNTYMKYKQFKQLIDIYHIPYDVILAVTKLLLSIEITDNLLMRKEHPFTYHYNIGWRYNCIKSSRSYIETMHYYGLLSKTVLNVDQVYNRIKMVFHDTMKEYNNISGYKISVSLQLMHTTNINYIIEVDKEGNTTLYQVIGSLCSTSFTDIGETTFINFMYALNECLY